MSKRIIDTERASVGVALKQLGFNFCIAFTIFTLMSMVAGMVFGDQAAREHLVYAWTMVGALLLAAVLQMVFFTPVVIKRIGYGARMAGFGVCLFAVLAVCGAVFDWFPADNVGAWISFAITYLVILALMSALFTAIYRRKSKQLDESLAKFKDKAQR